jgi:predicted nucleic acid binding AN1-type Zn finger protein
VSADIVSLGLRSFFILLDCVGHISCAVRAAEEFERASSLRKGDKNDLGPAHAATAAIPL